MYLSSYFLILYIFFCDSIDLCCHISNLCFRLAFPFCFYFLLSLSFSFILFFTFILCVFLVICFFIFLSFCCSDFPSFLLFFVYLSYCHLFCLLLHRHIYVFLSFCSYLLSFYIYLCFSRYPSIFKSYYLSTYHLMFFFSLLPFFPSNIAFNVSF